MVDRMVDWRIPHSMKNYLVKLTIRLHEILTLEKMGEHWAVGVGFPIKPPRTDYKSARKYENRPVQPTVGSISNSSVIRTCIINRQSHYPLNAPIL
uniref:Uncharacterized protein n=1 Tax=Cucumis melo TaxID=3656 RepID=A0A9I9EA68_CUCME